MVSMYLLPLQVSSSEKYVRMAPNGMLNKIVVKLSKPNDLIMSDPNVDMPPLAIL